MTKEQAILGLRFLQNSCESDEDTEIFTMAIKALEKTPTHKVGKWIYNRDIQNWVCSECSETPKTLGYCGTSAFMKEHFKFCNHCGTEMVGVENE